ncbi:LCP family protein [Clostridium lacusfryxellense]|uniref:LCP family protein n=1 Tax=Clostridium lacusfryxellense TaxID=205328 RepID=UPI001C0D98A8|nr:LCP family protein [Clostridium lacusfryxellense]MBU3110434.1 LCP family protein [Clostridium lacusfryxellense]
MNNNSDNKRKKIINYKRFAIVTITVVVTALVLVFGCFYFYLAKFNNSATDLSENRVSTGLNADDVERIKKDGKSCNILVMGVDVGTPGATNVNDPKRTDTLILAHYNAENKKINLISIPRDTLIQVNGKNQKINAAHAIGGVKYAVAAVETLLDIQIDYYGKINYEGFDKVINAIGGVDMDITRQMDYDDPTQDLSIHFDKGTSVHLDGKKAEEFFRWRKNNDLSGFENGDLGRIQNQHIFISKVMEKVKSPIILIKIPSILSAVKSSVETNMDANEILKYGYIFATIEDGKLSMDTIKGDLKDVKGISYVVYSDAQNEKIISELNNGDVLNVDKSKLKIKIINGTKTVGLASDYSSYLVENGYNKAVTGNGDAASKSKISVYNGDENMKTQLKKDFKIDNIEFLSSSDGEFDIVVVLGDDHKLMH